MPYIAKSKIVITRKEHHCFNCSTVIKKGERVWNDLWVPIYRDEYLDNPMRAWLCNKCLQLDAVRVKGNYYNPRKMKVKDESKININ